jgi:polyisoprenoid-binding protein YceI
MTIATTRVLDGVTFPGAATYVLDSSHTTVGFVVRHLMVAKVRGRFTEFEGSITVADNLLDSSAEATIKVASIDTAEATRDGHLRTGDFFDAEQFPNMTFRSTKVERKGETSFKVTGDLGIRGVTRPVVLDVELEGTVQDPWGNTRIVLTASTEIDREDWGMTYNQALETGGVLVGKKVKIEIEAEAVRQA